MLTKTNENQMSNTGAFKKYVWSISTIKVTWRLLFSSPHTGIQEYQNGVPKIPTACITVEDAEMMSRMASRGNKIVIQLKMGAKSYPDADSFNTVAEITGSKYPEQVSEDKGKGWTVWEQDVAVKFQFLETV